MTNPQYQPQQPGQPYPPQAPPKKKRCGCMKVVLIVLAALIGVFILVAILVTAIGPSESEEVAPADPQAALADAIADVVDDPVVDVQPNRVNVEYHIGGSTALMAQDDTLEILSAVKNADLPDGLPTVEITGNAEFVSELGEKRDGMAFRALYSPDLIERMNPEDMSRANAWEVTDNRFVHPALGE
ncbi:hypothetical protein M3G04_02255 [Dietzia cinnamea]|uniref:hypothetical protein n=1 Tax=Dietzia cinnamea TaxID=321318 RepID=UPI00223B5B45|nr:hypothetical protein [Dietzia cinnamea]MCT2299732.1 hypothetical protein [Dietzia cinnamea]